MLEVKNKRLTRLEKYLVIMNVLSNWDLITQKQLMHKADINLLSPTEYFNFLVKLDLIIERTLGGKTVYCITPKGKNACMYFRLVDDRSIFLGTRIVRID